ncbi:hypothetical protein Sps_04743 [Shewanella psychrophila]|uniref:Uncharacterized protein n=1 Tax=Shewanella psychrophila TaxID=225848 RepID=A0A1S6HMC2_9GAMM|nr:hypothetical protein [Shewanella psychrophila]AQS36675.1 hypothetical protein Sps_01509 [Shewanella psychrophila]AQS39826.1 hypothetical protein Sps_04743 [Shewanella psychrophila]
MYKILTKQKNTQARRASTSYCQNNTDSHTSSRQGALLPFMSNNIRRVSSLPNMSISLESSQTPNNKIKTSQQVADDLELFCEELMDHPSITSVKNMDFESRRGKGLLYRLQAWAYQQYREAVDEDVKSVDQDRHYGLLKDIVNRVPNKLSVEIQYLDTALTNNSLYKCVAPEHSLVLTRLEDGISNTQEGRLSLKIKPECYFEVFQALTKFVLEQKDGVSHAKLMPPITIGSGPEDAVIYMNKMDYSKDISTYLKGLSVLRSSEIGIFFMDEVTSGCYSRKLPTLAYDTSEGGSAGSLGMFFTKLAVDAAIQHKISGDSISKSVSDTLHKNNMFIE